VSFVLFGAESSADLPTASQETLLLATLDDLDVLYLARHDGTQPIRLGSDIGLRLPAARRSARRCSPRSIPARSSSATGASPRSQC
jgi:DNA-binding IclR family transcriptional regulator